MKYSLTLLGGKNKIKIKSNKELTAEIDLTRTKDQERQLHLYRCCYYFAQKKFIF